MLSYRKAKFSDAEQIGLLHADSWKRHYRGMLEDDFLDHRAASNRIQVWLTRLDNPAANQWVLLAEEDSRLLGFICVYSKDDPTWGSLIDNLHVAHNSQGKGIGTWLMMQARCWLEDHFAGTGVYLWVMQDNPSARRFYEMLGASEQDTVDKPNPAGGGSAFNCRYSWATPGDIIVAA